MEETKKIKNTSAFIAVQERPANNLPYAKYLVHLKGQKSLFQ